MSRSLLSFCLIFITAGLTQPVYANEATVSRPWFFDAASVPQALAPSKRTKPVVIAIVDDGLRATHDAVRGFIWRNPDENGFNQIDDDENGFVDDRMGWDIADNDESPRPPDARAAAFSHGTHLASVISAVASEALGPDAPRQIKLMAVKTISDDAPHAYLKQGYQGIQYAINSGADIVLAAWSLGLMSSDESRVLNDARQKGVLIVASAGNFPEQKPQYPAAHNAVLAVTGLDESGQKMPNANYGGFVDLAAPATNIRGASAESDSDYIIQSGTSQAAAIVAAGAALVKLKHPEYGPDDLSACLLNGAKPVSLPDTRYSAKLGAGRLNIAGALACDLETGGQTIRVNHRGYIGIDHTAASSAQWSLQLPGEFEGIRFEPVLIRGAATNAALTLKGGNHADSTPLSRYRIEELPASIHVPARNAEVHFDSQGISEDFRLLLRYEAQPIRFSELYCKGTQSIDSEGLIGDGSGEQPYAFNSDCKWLITAPPGKLIEIRFQQLDIEAKKDSILVFDGAATNAGIMAVYSGSGIPPTFTSRRNQALLWFVTNDSVQKQGWSAEIKFRDAE